MKSWMYVVPFIQILYTVVNGTCTKGQSCELREWVQWDCKNCCTMNAEPDSAIRKRKICCAEQDDLAMCLVHCNISKDSVEEKGLCKDHCKCSGAFPMPLITIHAAGVSVNNGPALHVTTAFRKPSTNSPGNPSSNITVSRTAVTSTVKTQKSSTLIANLSNADHTVDSATKKITGKVFLFNSR